MKMKESKNAKIIHGQRSTANQDVEIPKYLHYLLLTVDRGPTACVSKGGLKYESALVF